MEMLAAQAAHREDGSAAGDEDSIIADIKLSDPAKRVMLQKSLHMAASNGDVERVRRLVSGSAKNFIDVNGVDEEGTAPLIYASCFVCPAYIIRTRKGYAHNHARAIKMLFRPCSTLGRKSTVKIGINGRL